MELGQWNKKCCATASVITNFTKTLHSEIHVANGCTSVCIKNADIGKGGVLVIGKPGAVAQSSA